jgi:Uma2 family endonuclease
MGEPAPRKRATYADIEAAPEHLIAEIVDGELVTQPRPAIRHNATATALIIELADAFQRGRGGPGGWLFLFENEVKFGDDLLVPDVAGWRVERLVGLPETNWISVRPDFVCEVLSRSTEKRDRTAKRRIYGQAGVPHYWLIDPRRQTLEAFELDGGEWRPIGNWRAADEVRAAPFDSLAFSLADLWPFDKPLGFNEERQALFEGDR